MGWTFPGTPRPGSDFNYDFHVTLDEAVAPVEYNYRNLAELEPVGSARGQLHGTSVFLRDGDRVFHTYSTYARGTEQVGGTHYYLDMTALGRQEDWEEPRGSLDRAPRADQSGPATAERVRVSVGLAHHGAGRERVRPAPRRRSSGGPAGREQQDDPRPARVRAHGVQCEADRQPPRRNEVRVMLKAPREDAGITLTPRD